MHSASVSVHTLLGPVTSWANSGLAVYYCKLLSIFIFPALSTLISWPELYNTHSFVRLFELYTIL